MRFGSAQQQVPAVPARPVSLAPGQFVCLAGQVEPIFTIAVVGVPRPADFGLNLFGARATVPVTSSQPALQQLLAQLQGQPVQACGTVREAVGSGPFAGVRAQYVDAYTVWPLGFPLAPFVRARPQSG